jgi:hypothetical protein
MRCFRISSDRTSTMPHLVYFLLGTVTGEALRLAPSIVTPSTLPTERSR